MKKIVMYLLLIAMITVMAACGKKEETPSGTDAESTKAAEVTKEAENTPDKAADNESKDKEEPTKEPVKEEKAPTKKPAAEPTKKPTAVPTKEPTPEPTAEPIDYDEDEGDYLPNYSDDVATIDSIWGQWIEKGEDYPYARSLEIGRSGEYCLYNTDGSKIEGKVLVMDTYDEHNPFVYDFLSADRSSIVMECYWDISWHSPMMELSVINSDLTFVRSNEFGEYDPENLYAGTLKANDYMIRNGWEEEKTS